MIHTPKDSKDKQAKQEPETTHDDVLGKGFLEGGGVVEVPWMAGRAVKTECLTRQFLACACVVCFGELNGFVGAAV